MQQMPTCNQPFFWNSVWSSFALCLSVQTRVQTETWIQHYLSRASCHSSKEYGDVKETLDWSWDHVVFKVLRYGSGKQRPGVEVLCSAMNWHFSGIVLALHNILCKTGSMSNVFHIIMQLAVNKTSKITIGLWLWHLSIHSKGCSYLNGALVFLRWLPSCPDTVFYKYLCNVSVFFQSTTNW
jgi:hypothetical protein